MITKRFLVALSFPGEYRDYVSQVAESLAEALGKNKVFYDQWYTAELAQPDMDVLLQSFYHDHSELIVPFLGADYERKEWCGLEWRAIKDLIKQRQSKDIMPMRFDNAQIPGFYGTDGYVDLKNHSPKEAAELILERLHLNCEGLSATARKIHSDRLPTVKGDFFGREAELKLLDDAWAGNGTRIIQFIAPGGTGKTKLLRHWLDHTNDIDVLISWSFYSQGSSEDKQVSASPFFSHAFEKLGSTRTTFAREEDRGEHLADLLRQQQHWVLVLDGLEPLQHAGKGMRGELKDRAMRQLLRSLAGKNNGLCIITTRIAVHELSDRAHVVAHDLQNLAPGDGVKLLQSLGVNGNNKELEKTVREYGCHALALSLLGNVLRLRHEGDVLKRDTLKDLVKPDGNQASRHAFKVMQAYEDWFDGEPELALLHLLGLFDHPIGQDVLQVLWDEQIIGLTFGLMEEDWLEAITALREEHHLLSRHGGTPDDQLDCHPLIREYFGHQLLEKQPEAWQRAHTGLYEYYKTLPKKEFPDTLEEMQPLFNAVAHGCAAGLYQQALEDVYYPRIKRKVENFLTKKLGAYSDDLAVVVNFFSKPWSTPALGLSEEWQFATLNWAGFRLNAVGRVREALAPAQTAIELAVKNEEWDSAAGESNSLSGMQLTLGDIALAVASSQRSVSYANKIRSFMPYKLFELQRAYAIYANALYQSGENALAAEFFITSENFQKMRQFVSPRLFSRQGFYFCNLLLGQNRTMEVMKRAKFALKISLDPEKHGISDMGLLDVALDRLTLGLAYMQQRNFPQATHWLDQAVANLYEAGSQGDLPHDLLARSALYRDTRNPNHNFTRARQDLREVFDIAEPSGMRLHLTDYHLEMARLLIAEKENPPQSPFFKGGSQGSDVVVIPPLEKGGPGGRISVQEHVTRAEKLIEETGYKRRLPELQALQKIIGEQSFS